MNDNVDEKTEPSKHWLSGWAIPILIGVFVLFQWQTLRDTLFSAAGMESSESPIKWQHDMDTALDSAKAQQRPVLIVFGASWCPPCKRMKRDVWPDPQVAEFVEANFVPLYVDVDDRSQAELSKRYNVSSIPAVFVVDAEGKTLQQQAFMSAPATLDFLKSAL